MFRRFLVFVACSFMFVSGVYASCSDEKVYLAADQLICADSGIFVLLENTDGQLAKILVPQVNWDQCGLYVLAEHLPMPELAHCRYGHPACKTCLRCNQPKCPSSGCRCR